ncbi:hypothetical protein GQ54DRAFT_149407 [Martensiomyces pterosporus]|nr:hypothetical protein GQ54DRAFT_149407 [Martensiomyces pterosporus]
MAFLPVSVQPPHRPTIPRIHSKRHAKHKQNAWRLCVECRHHSWTYPSALAPLYAADCVPHFGNPPAPFCQKCHSRALAVVWRLCNSKLLASGLSEACSWAFCALQNGKRVYRAHKSFQLICRRAFSDFPRPSVWQAPTMSLLCARKLWPADTSLALISCRVSPPPSFMCS